MKMLMLPLTNRKNQRRWVAAMFYTLITINSLSSRHILSIFDHATLKNYISAVIYSSISSYTSLERAKIKLSEKKYS